jgi:pyruvate/2-oxoglutarate dehydrogenase complex dihydrolipoamide acyltransferase (E2) component
MLVPRLAISMTQATLSEWLADDGAIVAEGQPLYVLENDKVETEIEAPSRGVLRRFAEAGETYQVGDLLAEIVPAE